ncbi:MAG: hypothetical protein IPO40_20420 [Fibrobacteres bacterium]|nr:hypothetical protein [Fibrobacterota bacterium]
MIKMPLTLAFTLVAVSISLAGGTRESLNSDENYETVFRGVSQTKPVIINSRVEFYTPSFLFWKLHERVGEWEFELIASESWLNEVKSGFVKAEFSDPMRIPSVQWWKPNPEGFDAFSLPFSSHSSSHMFIQKNPKADSGIHIFMQRH